MVMVVWLHLSGIVSTRSGVNMMINFPHCVLYPRKEREPTYKRRLLKLATGCGVPNFMGMCVLDMDRISLEYMVCWLADEVSRTSYTNTGIRL